MNVHGFIYTVDRVVKRLDPPFVVGRILWIRMLKVYYDCILLHCRCCVNLLFKLSWRLQYMDFKIKKGIHPYMVNPFTWGKKWIWNSFLSEWIPPSCILIISCYSMTKMLSIGILKKVRKNKNPRRSFNPHGYVNNNTVCSSLCYINVRLKIQNIFDLGYWHIPI